MRGEELSTAGTLQAAFFLTSHSPMRVLTEAIENTSLMPSIYAYRLVLFDLFQNDHIRILQLFRLFDRRR